MAIAHDNQTPIITSGQLVQRIEGVQIERECDTCYGKGQLEVDNTFVDCVVYFEGDTCPRCNGTGKLTETVTLILPVGVKL